MSDQHEIVVRSYRRVFRFERRIYRIDRFVIPVPGGIPLRGLFYFLVALLTTLAASLVPPVHFLLGLMPAPLPFLIAPTLFAALASHATPDGRAAHHFVTTWLAQRRASRRTVGGRAVTAAGAHVFLDATFGYTPDASDPCLRRGRVRGPALVTFHVPVELARSRTGWCARSVGAQAAGGPSVPLALGRGELLELRP